MNIAVVGGVERNESELALLARRAGHRLEYHGGHVGGRGAEGLRAAIERADVVVLQTVINSHGSMYLAKKLARQLGRKLVVVRTCGPSRLLALLDELQPSTPIRTISMRIMSTSDRSLKPSAASPS
jgi:hypothetical protein